MIERRLISKENNLKYKTLKIKGTKACPEWLAEAMVKGEAVECMYLEDERLYIVGWTGYSCIDSAGCDFDIDDVKPITAWEPQEGEVVLAWDDKDTAAYPLIFDSISDNRIWGMFLCTDMDPGGVGLSCFSNITKFSIELYTKPISEWPKVIEIIHVENIKEEEQNTR